MNAGSHTQPVSASAAPLLQSWIDTGFAPCLHWAPVVPCSAPLCPCPLLCLSLCPRLVPLSILLCPPFILSPRPAPLLLGSQDGSQNGSVTGFVGSVTGSVGSVTTGSRALQCMPDQPPGGLQCMPVQKQQDAFNVRMSCLHHQRLLIH